MLIKKITFAALLALSTQIALAQNSYPTTGTAVLNSGNDVSLVLKDSRTGTNWNYILWQFNDGASDWLMGRHSTTGYFTIARSGIGDIFTIDNSGKVGIGTTEPGYAVDVVSRTSTGGNLLRVRPAGITNDYLSISNATGMAGQFVPLITGYQSNESQAALYLTATITGANDSWYNPVMIFDSRLSTGQVASRALFAWDSYGNRKMTLSASGSLGIGTNLPQNTLDVVGNSNISGGLDVQGVVNFSGGNLSQICSIADNNNAAFINTSTTGNGLYSAGGGTGRYSFHFVNQAGSSIMYGGANGNVGIGTLLTSNPNNYRLAVNGKIGAKEIIVETTSSTWPDYVFSDDYKLPSLLEVERYLKANKHLPEVPSAEEVRENGLSVGEMNAILLKKVEELTIYVIELNKSVGDQKKINESLMDEIATLKKNNK